MKKSKMGAFILILFLFIALIAFAPILFNFKRLNNIGFFEFGGTDFLEYPEGSVGINTEVIIEHQQGAACDGDLSIRTFSSGDITVYGITHIEYSVKANSGFFEIVDENFNPVANSWSDPFSISLYANSNVTVIGSCELNVRIGSVDQSVVINFNIDYYIPMNVSEIFYLWDIPLMWVYMLYVVLFFVVLSYVIKFYKSIKFDYYYTDEMRTYDEKYFDYITQKQESE